MNKERLEIVEPNLVIFCNQLQTAIQEGFQLCTTDSPNMWGTAYQAILYRDEKKHVGRPKEQK